jgi:biopolymer transport protein ExbB/TolQ
MENFASVDVIKIFKEGGPFMILVLCISIASAILIVERYLALRFRYHIDGRQLFNEVKKFLAVNDTKRALEVCRQYPLAPLAQVLAAGIQQIDQGPDEAEIAMETETLYYVPKINERLQYLPSLANTATLVGLLGTITGLIISFSASSGAQAIGGLTKEQALAHGISFAMYTTAFALMVAIPTVLAAMFLGAKANRLIDDIDHYASALKHLVQRRKSGQALETTATGAKVDLNHQTQEAAGVAGA